MSKLPYAISSRTFASVGTGLSVGEVARRDSWSNGISQNLSTVPNFFATTALDPVFGVTEVAQNVGDGEYAQAGVGVLMLASNRVLPGGAKVATKMVAAERAALIRELGAELRMAPGVDLSVGGSLRFEPEAIRISGTGSVAAVDRLVVARVGNIEAAAAEGEQD
ncbi:hypothetical protein ACQ86G_18915 [Roseateles chitinivorans]|uniref:hypothetical protein n=1 Tax=Roseateles chitinivorans TaxID=2917965 RepID=UPI003D67F2B0